MSRRRSDGPGSVAKRGDLTETGNGARVQEPKPQPQRQLKTEKGVVVADGDGGTALADAIVHGREDWPVRSHCLRQSLSHSVLEDEVDEWEPDEQDEPGVSDTEHTERHSKQQRLPQPRLDRSQEEKRLEGVQLVADLPADAGVDDDGDDGDDYGTEVVVTKL